MKLINMMLDTVLFRRIISLTRKYFRMKILMKYFHTKMQMWFVDRTDNFFNYIPRDIGKLVLLPTVIRVTIIRIRNFMSIAQRIIHILASAIFARTDNVLRHLNAKTDIRMYFTRGNPIIPGSTVVRDI